MYLLVKYPFAPSVSSLVKPSVVVLPVVDPHLQQAVKNQIVDLIPSSHPELLRYPDHICKQGIVII